MLKGENIYLRALEPEDVHLLYVWENDASIWHLSNTLAPFSKKNLNEYISNSHFDIYTSKQLRLMICKNDAKAIGCIDLFDFDPQNYRAGIGILIADTSERKKGYATEALTILKEYCNEKLNLHQLYCSISVDNESSFQLFTKNGFEHSGTKKQWLRSIKGYMDEYFLQCILN